MDEKSLKSLINQKLIRSGEKDRLKEYLRLRLVECGWRDEMKKKCKDLIKQKGLDRITVDELVQDMTPRGRATVPDAVKKEVMTRIRKFIDENAD